MVWAENLLFNFYSPRAERVRLLVLALTQKFANPVRVKDEMCSSTLDVRGAPMSFVAPRTMLQRRTMSQEPSKQGEANSQP